jgi:hypothetical protein
MKDVLASVDVHLREALTLLRAEEVEKMSAFERDMAPLGRGYKRSRLRWHHSRMGAVGRHSR